MSDRSLSSAAAQSTGWHLENTYAELPQAIQVRIAPVPVAAPRLVKLNRGLAESLGLDPAALESSDAPIFAGNAQPPASRPLAQAYAGHQFGNFTTLGDGRAVLLGEQITPGGGRFDIQLKGSGRTPFSRGGDGRAALGPMLREYLISEAMHALGIPTTRSLAVAATGEEVWGQEGALPGAVLTRVAASHIRVGTFEAVPVARDREILRQLTGYTLRRHFPDLADAENPALDLLDGVIGRQAELIARWMGVGFVHGVMNTDNMALSGETIDYGPCAFMEAYDPPTVFSSIDRHGRYAYGNQPAIAQWNLALFAETLLPLLHDEEKEAIGVATEAVKGFIPRYEDQWLAAMRRKLGLFHEEPGDRELVGELLEWMRAHAADFTNTSASMAREPDRAGEDCQPDDEFLRWRERWQARLERQPESPGNRSPSAAPATPPSSRAITASKKPWPRRSRAISASSIGCYKLSPPLRPRPTGPGIPPARPRRQCVLPDLLRDVRGMTTLAIPTALSLTFRPHSTTSIRPKR